MDKEMEGYARDGVRLAGMTDDPEIREALMKMAREWMEAAVGEHRERTKPAQPNARAAVGVASTFAHPCAGEGEAHDGPRQGLACLPAVELAGRQTSQANLGDQASAVR